MSSSHALFTAALEIALDLLERGDAFALEVAVAGDGVNRRCREAVLNLQPVSHYALEQLTLNVCHEAKLPCLPTGEKTRLRRDAKLGFDRATQRLVSENVNHPCRQFSMRHAHSLVIRRAFWPMAASVTAPNVNAGQIRQNGEPAPSGRVSK